MSKQISILGAGKLGITISQLAVAAGYKVYIASSGKPDKIALSVHTLSPGATPTTATEAINRSGIVLLALPLGKFRSIPANALNGKLIIDAMNYWWEVDGKHPELQNPNSSTSELVQDYFHGSRVVKAISHMGYHHLRDEAAPKGRTGRKALAVAADNPSDAAVVSKLIDDLGFDPLPIGDLRSGKVLEPGHPAFGANVTITKLRTLVV